MEYKVTWECFIEADSPKQAAELAGMQAYENVVKDGFVFRVEPNGHRETVPNGVKLISVAPAILMETSDHAPQA